ncbi:MAG: hypothetical protein ABI867_24210, partial [Kofleriaceae bacterium]
ADKLLTSPQLTITPAVELAAGWHDLVIDTHKVGGVDDAHMAFTVETGPAFVGQAFPADHVRPVIGRIGRFASAFALPGLDVPDGASLLTTVAMDLPAEFAAIRADAGFQVDHPVLGQLSVLLDPPAGANITLASFGELLGTGSTFRHEAIPLDRLGSSFAFTTSDALADGITGTLNAAGVTAIGNGGVAPFPLRYVYESAIHELGDVAALGSMTWGLRQQSAITTAIVRLRTCDHEADCGDEDWTEVAFDTVPEVAPRRFAQYQLEVTTNGDVPTAVDFVDLAYSRFAP